MTLDPIERSPKQGHPRRPARYADRGVVSASRPRSRPRAAACPRPVVEMRSPRQHRPSTMRSARSAQPNRACHPGDVVSTHRGGCGDGLGDAARQRGPAARTRSPAGPRPTAGAGPSKRTRRLWSRTRSTTARRWCSSAQRRRWSLSLAQRRRMAHALRSPGEPTRASVRGVLGPLKPPRHSLPTAPCARRRFW